MTLVPRKFLRRSAVERCGAGPGTGLWTSKRQSSGHWFHSKAWAGARLAGPCLDLRGKSGVSRRSGLGAMARRHPVAEGDPMHGPFASMHDRLRRSTRALHRRAEASVRIEADLRDSGVAEAVLRNAPLCPSLEPDGRSRRRARRPGEGRAEGEIRRSSASRAPPQPRRRIGRRAPRRSRREHRSGERPPSRIGKRRTQRARAP